MEQNLCFSREVDRYLSCRSWSRPMPSLAEVYHNGGKADMCLEIKQIEVSTLIFPERKEWISSIPLEKVDDTRDRIGNLAESVFKGVVNVDRERRLSTTKSSA